MICDCCLFIMKLLPLKETYSSSELLERFKKSFADYTHLEKLLKYDESLLEEKCEFLNCVNLLEISKVDLLKNLNVIFAILDFLSLPQAYIFQMEEILEKMKIPPIGEIVKNGKFIMSKEHIDMFLIIKLTDEEILIMESKFVKMRELILPFIFNYLGVNEIIVS